MSQIRYRFSCALHFVKIVWLNRLFLVVAATLVCVLLWLYQETSVRNDYHHHKLNYVDFQSNTIQHKNSIENGIFQLINYQYAQLEFNGSNVGDNVTGFENLIVPDIVHYVQLENPYTSFTMLISIMSVLKHHQPKLILIHTDRLLPRGKYWEKVLELNESSRQQQSRTIIKLNRIKRPKFIFGKKLSSVYHASDISRLRTLQRFGGIFLDNDVYVVKPLHSFRKYEFAIGWPENQFLGTQVLICHKNARFLHKWYESYRNYVPTRWYYNAGELPTTSILDKEPNLVHRVKTEFGVHNLAPMLYNERYPYWEKEFYTVHLLSRHRKDFSSKSDKIQYLNEYNIRDYNWTFGEMARLVYFGKKNL